MNEFNVELFIDSVEGGSMEFSRLSEKNIEQWKKDMEARAVSVYYNKKIKIQSKKI